MKRLTKVCNYLRERKLDAFLISSVPNIIYLTAYSGFSKEEREAYLLITARPQGLTHKTPGVLGYIFTDGRYIEAVKKVQDFEIIEVSSNSLILQLKKLIGKLKLKRLGFEKHNLTVEELEKFSFRPQGSTHGLNVIEELRVLKEPEEILAIERACRLGDKAFSHVLKKIKPGTTEKELALEIELFVKKHGADISFPPIVAFGANSSIPHHQTSDQRLKTNDQILLDFGVKIDNYCSDMTRTVFFGPATREQKRIYKTVLEAQQKAIEFIQKHLGRWSASWRNSSEVDKVARDYIISKGYPTIPHSLGHGIGLEVHEAPRFSPQSKDILKPGMVFSIEPGIYLPGFGGVRIEDLVLLENSGPRLLTKARRELILAE